VVSARSKLATICAALNEAGARYVVIGAQAMILWGAGRATRDVDLLIEATAANAQNVLDALASLGFILVRDLDAADVASRPVTVIGDLWRVDLFTLAWAIRYKDAGPRGRTFTVDGIEIPAASIPDLIASKRTGRLQDAADIEVLEEIQRRLGSA
jgi:predicted nucleotidyltransferase